MGKKVFEIVLLRHGRSEADDKNLMEGRYNSKLTKEGIQQAENLAQRWKQKEMKFDRIVYSPLLRARETAEIIQQALGIDEFIKDPDWMEKDSGIIVGMPKEEAAKEYPIPSFISPYKRIVEGTGESLAELRIRAHRAISKILHMPPGKYLIVSHSEILNATLRSMMSIPMPRNAARKEGVFFWFKDTSYARLIYYLETDKWSFCEFVP